MILRCSLLALAWLAVTCSCSLAADETVPYVATDGNDAFSGTLAAQNADRSDGPFATLTVDAIYKEK